MSIDVDKLRAEIRADVRKAVIQMTAGLFAATIAGAAIELFADGPAGCARRPTAHWPRKPFGKFLSVEPSHDVVLVRAVLAVS